MNVRQTFLAMLLGKVLGEKVLGLSPHFIREHMAGVFLDEGREVLGHAGLGVGLDQPERAGEEGVLVASWICSKQPTTMRVLPAKAAKGRIAFLPNMSSDFFIMSNHQNKLQ